MRYLLSLLAIICLCLSSAWAWAAPTRTAAPTVPLTNEELFAKARKHMEKPETTDVRSLVTLTKQDKQVYWNTRKDKVKLVAFVTDATDFHVAQENVLSANLWCFSQKEFENWYKKHAEMKDIGSDYTLRLHQLTGLAPDAKERMLVTFWVSPNDVIRPANVTDVKIDAMEAHRANGRVGYQAGSRMFNLKQFQLDPSRHKGTDKVITRLGYTYDWKNAGHQYGLTEFMVVPFTKVDVETKYGIKGYIKLLQQKAREQ